MVDMLAVDEDLCVGCGLCVIVCPTEALEAWGYLIIDTAKCSECLGCIEICPVEALGMKQENSSG